jgi:hypothetical protein
MDHTRDVVFSASPGTFVWDAARINLPKTGDNEPPFSSPSASARHVRLPGRERRRARSWTRSTEYLKDAVERFSKRWYPLPLARGHQRGRLLHRHGVPRHCLRRHPGPGQGAVFWITAHEIGHSWFPMLVGSNERRNAFMDEGFNTFIDIDESDDFEGGVYGPKRDSEYSAGGEPPDTILKVLDNPDAPPILTRADGNVMRDHPPGEYFKGRLRQHSAARADPRPPSASTRPSANTSATGLTNTPAHRTSSAPWSEGGEDLSYFWRGWYMNNWTPRPQRRFGDLHRRRSQERAHRYRLQPQTASPTCNPRSYIYGRQQRTHPHPRRSVALERRRQLPLRWQQTRHNSNHRPRPRPTRRRPHQQHLQAPQSALFAYRFHQFEQSNPRRFPLPLQPHTYGPHRNLT